MARYWVYLNDGVQGPFELDQLIRQRGFSRQSRVCVEGANGEPGEWMSPADIPLLAPIFKAAEELHDSEPALGKSAPKVIPHSPARAAPRPRVIKERRGQWVKALSIVLVAGAVIVGTVWLILRQQRSVLQARETARALVWNAVLPDRQYPTVGRYLEEHRIKPRWEVEKVAEGVFHVSLSWFSDDSRRSNVYAFESNVAVLSVRGLNTAASRLLSEGLSKPVVPPAQAVQSAKKHVPSPAERFDSSAGARARAVEQGDFETVWNAFSRQKRSQMIQAGMSREGFIRLQGLTSKLESGLRQEILKSKTVSERERLVLIRETRPPHGEIFLKQRWILEEGEWKLDEEDKRAPEEDTAPSGVESPAPSKPGISVHSLPGISK